MPVLDNAHHEQFCHEYMKDLNATQAYLRAYPEASKESARRLGSKLLTKDDISQRISDLTTQRNDKLSLNSDMVLKEIADVAFANIGLVCDWDADGKITLIEKSKMSKRGLNAVANFSAIESYDKDGKLLSIKNKFSMNDKLKALELLSRHLGLLDGTGSEDKGKNKDSIRSRIFDIADRIAARTGNGGSKP